MSLTSPSCMSNRTTSFVWNPNEGNIVEDCRAIIELCKQYDKSNRILYLEQKGGSNKISNYIRLIELLGRYGLYNIGFRDVDLKRFTSKAIYLCKNPKFLSYWFLDFIGDSGKIVTGDRAKLEKVATLLRIISPKGIDNVGLSKDSVVVSCHGRQYSLTIDRKGWEDSDLPSFSIVTKQRGLLKFYLVRAGFQFSGQSSKLKLSKARRFICRYGATKYLYDNSLQKNFNRSSVRENSLYLMPMTVNANEIISLSEIDDYKKKYGFDDPSKGFGTRMFYYDEASMINSNIYPSSTHGRKVVTSLTSDEVAIHIAPSKFLKRSIVECQAYNRIIAVAPRMLIINQDRLDQLISEHIISIYHC